MVTIQVKNIEGKTVVLPVAGSQRAAGYDIVAVDDPVIVGESITKEGEFFPLWKRVDYIEYHTALFISPQDTNQYAHHNQEYHHTLIHPRSSVRKYNLVLANSIGLIDNDYRGEILCCFKYIWQPEDFVFDYQKVTNQDGTVGDVVQLTIGLFGRLNREKIYKKGDKIAQLVTSLTNPTEYVLVSELDTTERGAGGFGSTDAPKVVPKTVHVTEPKKQPIDVRPPQSSMHPAPDAGGAYGGAYGGLVERYAKAGGLPVRKKYSEEVKEREQQNQP